MDSEVTMQLSSQLQAMQNTFLPMMTNMMNMICNLQKDVEGVKQFVRDSQETRSETPCLPEKPQNETEMLQVDVFTGSDSQENNNTSKESDNTSPVVPSVAMLGDEPADDDRSTTTTTAVTEKILLAPLVVRKGSNRPAVEVTVNQRHRCVALLDTGADISLISGALYSSMCEQRGEDISPPTLISGPKDFDEFYGAPSPAAATTEVNISIGGMSFKHLVYITEEMPMPMLLGLDCLQRLDARLSGASGQLFARVRKPKPYKPWPDTGGRPSVACLSRGDAISTSPPLSKPPGRPPELLLQIEKVIDQADALTNDVERDQLRQLLLKYQDFLSLDSLDCGLTTIHEVRIPTRPDAPPSFVRQYKIPLASIEPVQEIIDSLLANGVIRPCNSTYSAPLWPVLKPNGKWRLTIDYRQLNKQVPLSRWPMARLEQELPKVKDAKYFSTLDIASGFWTIPVHESDQHKLAFSFANRQYTFTRCPFGYSNSPAEFNIFLNKACPDARERGTLIYVDDILIRRRTLDDHLAELDHVMGQLAAAGAKISLAKGQWCRSQVQYVGLLVGPQGVQPQLGRIQGVATITPPTNVSELRSFLGVCNYSRQFVEHYAELARPLTNLLKKDVAFEWAEQHQQAMDDLKAAMCSAPCLALPDCDKEFHLEVGFSAHCLSAGLYQIHDCDRRVVAYASKLLTGPELKYSDCEKALLSTMWAVKYFANYIGGQKIIIETQHQPVTFLNSQRIRDGVVTNSRIASWLLALQSFDIEVRYAQNRRSPLGMGLAACQHCSDDAIASVPPARPPQALLNRNHHYYDQSYCAGLPTVYVDGSAFRHGSAPSAGVGVVWVDGDRRESRCYSLGEKTSQYAEVAGIVIALRSARDHGFRELVVCTDSDYARLSFLCHLPTWKSNGFQTASRKPVKNQALFRACDILVTTLDMHIYWRKVKGHSRAPGPEKELNDLADSLAKQGATDGPLWVFEPGWLEGHVWSFPDENQVCVVTRARAAKASDSGQPKGAVAVQPAYSDTDLVSLQSRDPAISRMIKYISDPKTQLPTSVELDSVPELRSLFRVRSTLRVVEGLLMHAAKPPSPPVLVTPKPLRRDMISQAHDSPSAGHKGVKATFGALCQVAYWPGMRRDISDHVERCLVCCQFQPSNPTHRAPLQEKGPTTPWSDLQFDWVGPLTKSTRGSKYILTVTCAFTKWVECLPAPDDTAKTTAILLLNHVFARFGLPTRVDSDRGTHFTSDVMKHLWELLGVKAKFHISHRPQSSGQVERVNRTVISMLKKYVKANHRDWDVKLPLVLMAIRATPHESTGVSPFEMMTGRQMTLPLHLLYQRQVQSDTAPACTSGQYLQDLRNHLLAAFSFAQASLEKSAEGRKTYYDKKASHSELDVGDQAWYYIFAPKTGNNNATSGKLAKKLLPRWSGPYLITDKISPVVYQIKIADKNKAPVYKWVHRDHIKLHKGPTDLADTNNNNPPTSKGG
uniref:Gypsy retrotransposon integrase-like protein 1 n=1 Tax=Nothobranchius furzeri TaxID=105023 RepID=A0A8C6LKG8_NOTFU